MSVPLKSAFKEMQALLDRGSLSGVSDAQLLERFVAHRDEAAFEAIVARHGRMVLNVCRGVLANSSDVDDAFQAAFLVLVRKADAIWIRDSLASWLYRVSHRIAVEANKQSAGRRKREQSADDPAQIEAPVRKGAWTDTLPILHAEIDRLPEKYREALVLCDLEEKTHNQAAAELGLPAGTISTRVSRARLLLKDRLRRKGVTVGLPIAAFFAEIRSGEAAPWTSPRPRSEARW